MTGLLEWFAMAGTCMTLPGVHGRESCDNATQAKMWIVIGMVCHGRYDYLEFTDAKVDGVAQLVEDQIRDPKTGGSNPACVRSTRKLCENFFQVKNVLTRCRCTQPPCVYARVRMITYGNSDISSGLLQLHFDRPTGGTDRATATSAE